MCPDGSEGATYAALTTFGNIALNCAGSVGTLFAKVRGALLALLEEKRDGV